MRSKGIEKFYEQSKNQLPNNWLVTLRVIKRKVLNIITKKNIGGLYDIQRHLKELSTDQLEYLANEIIKNIIREGIYDKAGNLVKQEILMSTQGYNHKKESFLAPYYTSGNAYLILNKVLEILKNHPKVNLKEDKISINMEPSDLVNLRSLHLIAQHFSGGDSYNNITFEILEEDIDKKFLELLIQTINTLKDSYGFQFFLDDYGSGSTNMERVHLFHTVIDGIKIDWKYFQNSVLVDDSKEYRELKDEINHFKNLGLQVIIEGVETEELYRKSKELNGDLFQGWYFNEPRFSEDTQ